MSLTLFNSSNTNTTSLVVVTLPPGLSLAQFQHLERSAGEFLISLPLTYSWRFSHSLYYKHSGYEHFILGLVRRHVDLSEYI